MIGDLSYRLGTVVGTVAAYTSKPSHRMTASNPSNPPNSPNPPDPADASGGADARPRGDGDLLVDSILGAAAAWAVKKALRPRRVSWPRVVLAGVGATILADAVGRTFGRPSEERDRAYEDDPELLLVRLGAGIGIAAGYAALLYPRLPGSPLARGAIFGIMEVAAARHGGLVRVAEDTPGIKFPLHELAAPIDDAGPLSNLAFGLALGGLYRPPD